MNKPTRITLREVATWPVEKRYKWFAWWRVWGLRRPPND